MKTMKQIQKDIMPYTLITKKGKVMTFYIKAVAELYRQIEGGVNVTKSVLKVSKYKEIA